MHTRISLFDAELHADLGVACAAVLIVTTPQSCYYGVDMKDLGVTPNCEKKKLYMCTQDHGAGKTLP